MMKKRKNKYIYRYLSVLLKGNKRISIIAFWGMSITTGIGLFMPSLIGRILDHAVYEEDSSLFIWYGLLFIGLLVVSALLNIGLDNFYETIKLKASVKLKRQILDRLAKLSGKYYSNKKTGDLLHVLGNDMLIVENFGIELIFNFCLNAITACFAVFILWNGQPYLLIGIIIVQCAILVIQKKVSRVIVEKTENIRNLAGDLSNKQEEYVSNIQSIVVTGMTKMFFDRFSKQEKKFVEGCKKLNFILAVSTEISEVLNGLCQITIYVVGGFLVFNNKMKIGELIAFQQYSVMVIGPCLFLVNSKIRIKQIQVSLQRIYEVIDEPMHSGVDDYLIVQNDLKGDVVFNNVGFSYDKKQILDELNLHCKRGRITAIVGESGCGKSTIAKLLFRLWEMDSGNIQIDEVDITAYNIKCIRKSVNIVLQDVILLDDTIWQNVTMGEEYPKELVEEICSVTEVTKFVERLPEGYNTHVGENGACLSGGEKQRVAIARALLKDSNILVFDESTSALDNIIQARILENIKPYLANKTVIVIAHRLSIIKNTDYIYVIESGKIIESGNHEQLIIHDGKYKLLLDKEV